MTAITTAVTNIITWMGTVVTALFGQTGALADLLPFFAIGIACSVVLFAVRGIRSLVWGA